MELARIRQTIRDRRAELEAEGVTHLSLFGSRVRGDARPDSDLDLLVEVDPDARFSILELVGVENLISDATGIKANAFMRRSLDPDFRQSIGQEIVKVF